ncbi:MAG: hypothetical protein CVV02_16065 [Firmicutes bacterium HGW-Firmicutes-7]|nr:MAG: hypothetical protein CVV02_16065 [Firmicutes bacterium HGW-Firmicutes-7]
MLRLWGKLYKNNKIIQDTVICNNDTNLPTDKKVDLSLYEICMLFDLQKPIWLKDNHKDFKKFRRTSFRRDHFIEEIDFDYLEIEIIEEDK